VTDRPPDWNVAINNDGVQKVTHRHGDVEATAYLYSNPDEMWAECTMCPARITLPAGSITAPVSDK
jgi:hypothetical protein